MARKFWIGGNWKCNGTKESIAKLAEDFNKMTVDENKVEVVVCASPCHMAYTLEKMDAKKVKVGSQNVSKTGPGAFTGETSVNMLKDLGIGITLVGHSERRSIYGETDQDVADKVKIIQETEGLNVCICIGETLEEREADKTNEVNDRQLSACFPSIKDWSRVVVAYEPVWAIGTGKTATPEMADEAHKHIRELVASKVSKEVADGLRIVYGGSMNEKNAPDLLKMENIDGGLIGGVSLKPGFCDVVATAHSI